MQVLAVSAVVQTVKPDVLVLADVDYDLHGVTLGALADTIGGFPYRFARRPNRGLPSGRDLDGDGQVGGANDAEGYGAFAGQGGLAVLSRLPIASEAVRDFTAFAWADLPSHTAPEDGRNPTRLSTTAHWDVPVILPGGQALHLLVWHATAPVFDGPEDRNGRRNHDEAAFWLAYLDGKLSQTPPERFVLLGVANADPNDGDSRPGALRQLLSVAHDTRPSSEGAALAGIDPTQSGPPALDTVDWDDGPKRPGNLRVDYVLPAKSLTVTDSGVFWPAAAHPLAETVATASRHRLVWVDIELP